MYRLVISVLFIAILVISQNGYAQESLNELAVANAVTSPHVDHMQHMSMNQHDPMRFIDREHAVSQMSEKGRYRITLFSNVSPIPVQQIHSWTVVVEDAAGKPYEGRVFFSGGMPMHRHGFPTKPQSKRYLGDGNYLVEGIKFNMHGEWELRFRIPTSDGRADRAVFKVDLRPSSVQASHEWDEVELAVLRSMWIESLEVMADPSNRVSESDDAAKLGQQFFFDKRFSANGQVACATCHKPENYFSDGLPTSQGVGLAKRNAPSIVGARFHTWFFHDGRADSLWSQALGPMEDQREHGGSRTQYAHIVFNDADYRERYEKLFGQMPDMSDKARFPATAGPVKNKRLLDAWNAMLEVDRAAVTQVYVNIGKAIAAYEAKLIPASSRFDNYIKAALENNKAKMSELLRPDELAGLKLFLGKGNCTICHNGPMLSDLGFHNIATPPRNLKQYDWGRYKAVSRIKKSEFNCRSQYNDANEKQCAELDYLILHKEETAAAFKTPSLRNVSKTAPYMHAGQYQTLSEVMKHYAEPPSTKVGMSDLLPVDLNAAELVQLEAFLKTLDGPINAAPELLVPPTRVK